MKKRNLIAAGLISLAASSAFASFGKSGWIIFNKVKSSQFKAIAAAAPTNNNLSSVFYNPAVPRTKEKELLFMSETGLDGEALGGALFSQPLKNGKITGGFACYNAGPAELNWIENGELKSRTVCTQQDMLGILSYQHTITSKLSGGISLKAATTELAEKVSASAYASDIGILYTSTKNISISAALQNIGVSTKFLKKESPLPTSAFLGAGYRLGNDKSYITPVAGITRYINDEESVTEAGIEAGHGPIAFNIGHRFLEGDLNTHYGFQMNMNDMTVGYAYIPGTYLDPIHHLNISFKFGKSNNKIETTKSNGLENIVN